MSLGRHFGGLTSHYAYNYSETHYLQLFNHLRRKTDDRYLKAFGRLEERGERLLGYVYLPAVHELEEGLHIVGARPVENNDQSRGRRRHPFE